MGSVMLMRDVFSCSDIRAVAPLLGKWKWPTASKVHAVHRKFTLCRRSYIRQRCVCFSGHISSMVRERSFQWLAGESRVVGARASWDRSRGVSLPCTFYIDIRRPLHVGDGCCAAAPVL